MSSCTPATPLPLKPVDGLVAELRGRLSGATVMRLREPLALHTTFRVGGPADIYIEPASENDLCTALRFCYEHQLPWFVLGCGSNVLVRDGGFRGMVICLANRAFSGIAIKGNRLVCGAGARLKAVSETARRLGLAGLEFMDGIPGSVGGALRMNAGAMGSWTFDMVESVRCMAPDGQTREVNRAEIQAEYRACEFFDQHIALMAVFNARPGDIAQITERIRAYRRRRRQTQPAGQSAGCIFKNPHPVPAGRLIDELGLKGARIGRAYVSSKHANFILTEPGATASDVIALIELIRKRVKAERGIELEREVRIIGQDS